MSGDVQYQPPLIEGVLRRRYKRFLADVELPSGEVMVVHCANPGAMTTCAEVGGPVWLWDSRSDRRKLRYTWELAAIDGDMICVNTARGNQLVAEALEARAIPELGDYDSVQREVRVGDSRIDFALDGPAGRRLLEVKTVTLKDGDRGCAFPDSVTVRGQRHLEELIAIADAGMRATLLFVCARTGTDVVRPADEIDPDYGAALRRAAAAGVDILCYGCQIDADGMVLSGRIPVQLQ